MTDKFVVPSPSAEAIAQGRGPVQREMVSHWPLPGKPWYLHDPIVSASLAAAYKVDVPQIVRAEVERALGAMALKGEEEQSAMKLSPRRVWWDGNGAWRLAYLAARFGEPKCDGSGLPPTKECFHYWPKAGPGEKCEKCGYEWPTPTVGSAYLPTPRAPAVVSLDQGRLVSSPVYTDAERDFLRALAEVAVNRTGGRSTWGEAIEAAARRVVEEARPSGGLDGRPAGT